MRQNAKPDLWKNVQRGEIHECWPWLGNATPNGYGLISIAGRNHATHRVAYELATGLDPGGLQVCHTCDNPICCNPAHLYAGTASENQRDSVRRQRRPSRKGSRHPLAKLNEEQVRAIRERFSAGERNDALAQEFGVSPATISRVCRKYAGAWSHV